LRGSAGIAPASHSAGESPAYDHARTYFEKEQKQQPSQSTGQPNKKSITRQTLGGQFEFALILMREKVGVALVFGWRTPESPARRVLA
jgi:hypothetical protein